MPRKVLITALASTILPLGACTKARNEAPAPPAVAEVKPPPAASPAPPRPAAKRTIPRATPSPMDAPAGRPRTTQPDLPSLIQASSSWLEHGTTLLVVARGQSQPVPLFRQAIVLANVRSAVAGSPAAPRAEFRNGRLTLAFDRGTNPEIAAAVNRALSVPEVTRLEIRLPARKSG